MVTPSTLYEALGLPAPSDVQSDLARIREHFPEVTTRLEKADRWIEELGDRTGLPSYHDLFVGLEWLRDRVEESVVREDEPAEPASNEGDEEDEEDDDGLPWWAWMLGAAAAGYFIYKKLDHKVEITEDIGMEIPGFEIDGIRWTVERTRMPGPPMAARIADPLLHGGIAVPGPGSADVRISGRGALTVEHVVGACPMPHVTGLPHFPQSGPAAWKTTNGSVYVNGAPLLRAGDWVIEQLGGNNPIIAGAPLVLAGPPAAPCVVQEVTHRRLSEFVPGLERFGLLGGKFTVKATVSWSLRDMLGGAMAAGMALSGGPVGMWGARTMLALIDGPTLTLEFDFEATAFADLEYAIDVNRDGTIDHILEVRPRAKVTAESEHSAVLDPKRPGRAKSSKEGELEVDVDIERPEIELKTLKKDENP